MEGLDQYKQTDYVQKLKIDITPDFMDSGHQDLVTLLYGQVTHYAGMYVLCLIMHYLWTICGSVKQRSWYPGDLLYPLPFHWAHIYLYID